MSLVNAYCTDAELRAQFADEGARLNDGLLIQALNSASRAIDAYCGRVFWQDSGVVERTYKVSVPEYAFVDDISTRTGLIVKTGSDGVTFPTTLTSDADYILEPRNADKYASAQFQAYAFNQIRLVSGSFTCDRHRPTLSVTAQYGWSAVPAVVKETCILLAARAYKMKDAPFGFAGVNDFGPARIAQANSDLLSRLDAASLVLPGFA